jgi:hypothetical protein
LTPPQAPQYKEVWSKSFGKEIWRLATTTETVAFMEKQQIPQARHKDITYGQIVCVYCSEKKDPYCMHIMMGRNIVNYPDNCGTPTADLLTVKLMFNSIISTPNVKFMTINIKDFYLMTPMDRYKYFRMKLELFPQDIINEYGLRDKADADGNVFCEVQHGMYGLPQASIIAQNLLTKRLHKAGYWQSKITPGYWRHDWRPICFTLVVDDFGVKTSTRKTLNISPAYSSKTTRSTSIEKAPNTLASCSTGTMPHARSIYSCQVTLRRI